MATRLQRPGDQSPFILRTRSEVRKRLSADGSERRSRAPRRGGGAAHTQPRGAAPGGVGRGRPARPVCCAHGPFLPLRQGSGSGSGPPPRGRSPLPRPRALTKRCLSGRSGRPRPAPSANEHAGPGEASSAPRRQRVLARQTAGTCVCPASPEGRKRRLRNAAPRRLEM